jgi:hypothetical protein
MALPGWWLFAALLDGCLFGRQADRALWPSLPLMESDHQQIGHNGAMQIWFLRGF